MKYIICLLLAFIHWDAGHAQAVTRWEGNNTMQVQIVSLDTSKVKVYSADSPKFRQDSIRWQKYQRDWRWLIPETSNEPTYKMDYKRCFLLPEFKNENSPELDDRIVNDAVGGIWRATAIIMGGGEWDMCILPDSIRGKYTISGPVVCDTPDDLFGMPVDKYDTIGPFWRLVSDTNQGHWCPASAMWVWEVLKYCQGYALNPTGMKPPDIWYDPKHFSWLDSNKKPLKLVVWRAEIEK